MGMPPPRRSSRYGGSGDPPVAYRAHASRPGKQVVSAQAVGKQTTCEVVELLCSRGGRAREAAIAIAAWPLQFGIVRQRLQVVGHEAACRWSQSCVSMVGRAKG